MLKSTLLRITTVAFTLALGSAGCGPKAAPKSTTTTHTQTTTERDTGQKTTRDIKETRTEQADGTKDVVRTETTKQSSPVATP